MRHREPCRSAERGGVLISCIAVGPRIPTMPGGARRVFTDQADIAGNERVRQSNTNDGLVPQQKRRYLRIPFTTKTPEKQRQGYPFTHLCREGSVRILVLEHAVALVVGVTVIITIGLRDLRILEQVESVVTTAALCSVTGALHIACRVLKSAQLGVVGVASAAPAPVRYRIHKTSRKENMKSGRDTGEYDIKAEIIGKLNPDQNPQARLCA